MLTGFDPGLTATVRRVVLPSCRLLGLAAPMPVGGVEFGVTFNDIEAVPVRLCASVIVAEMFLLPAVVTAVTAALNEKTLSPAVTSP